MLSWNSWNAILDFWADCSPFERRFPVQVECFTYVREQGGSLSVCSRTAYNGAVIKCMLNEKSQLVIIFSFWNIILCFREQPIIQSPSVLAFCIIFNCQMHLLSTIKVSKCSYWVFSRRGHSAESPDSGTLQNVLSDIIWQVTFHIWVWQLVRCSTDHKNLFNWTNTFSAPSYFLLQWSLYPNVLSCHNLFQSFVRSCSSSLKNFQVHCLVMQ